MHSLARPSFATVRLCLRHTHLRASWTPPATLRHTCAGCRLHWAENATARMSAIAKGCVSQYKVHLQSYIGIFNCWIVVGLLLLFLRCGRRSVVVHQHSPNLNLRDLRAFIRCGPITYFNTSSSTVRIIAIRDANSHATAPTLRHTTRRSMPPTPPARVVRPIHNSAASHQWIVATSALAETAPTSLTLKKWYGGFQHIRHALTFKTFGRAAHRRLMVLDDECASCGTNCDFRRRRHNRTLPCVDGCDGSNWKLRVGKTIGHIISSDQPGQIRTGIPIGRFALIAPA